MDDTTDIAEAQASEPEAFRDVLLDQLAYLVDEIEALKTVVDGLPDAIKEGRPTPDALTMKEIYGTFCVLDAEVRRPRVTRIMEGDQPELEAVDVDEDVREGDWNERDIHAILEQIVTTRQQLVDQLKSLPLESWHRSATLEDETLSLFDLVHRITQQDTERLRSLGYRLHNAHLSDRDEPLPT